RDDVMRILMINDCAELGGAEVYIRNISRSLTEKGHKVFNFSVYESIERAEKKTADYFERIYFNSRLYRLLKRTIKETGPDIIHIHNNYLYTRTVLLACRGRKTVQTIHDYGVLCPSSWCVRKDDLKECRGKPGIRCVLHRCIKLNTYLFDNLFAPAKTSLIRRYIDAIIAPSEKLKTCLEKSGLRNVHHIPYSYFGKQNRKKSSSKIILYLGGLSRHKGLEYLTRAFDIVADSVKDAELWVIGKAENKGIAGDKAGKIRFFGDVDNDRIHEFYKKSSVVAVPSVWKEQFGIVGLEAMANSRPAVAFDAGGISEWLKDRENGFLVRRLDSRAFAEKIIVLLKDDKLRNKMGEKGYSIFARDFNPEKHCDRLLEIYEK
ncbi:glycosyltransferase family 4 protein, partial [Candidatus Woesearchaeota archaeon]|nr:glycosyltransferase family 4 protein [Candidatus Woesearchaeota archaeon]